MDPKLKRIIEAINTHRKTSHPWQRGHPFTQTYFTWQDNDWKPYTANLEHQPTSLGSFSVISWNIDFMGSFTRERMVVALAFLKTYIDKISKPTIVMLNEMLVSDLVIIQAQPWVRSEYVVTDIDAQFWESGYYGK